MPIFELSFVRKQRLYQRHISMAIDACTTMVLPLFNIVARLGFFLFTLFHQMSNQQTKAGIVSRMF